MTGPPEASAARAAPVDAPPAPDPVSAAPAETLEPADDRRTLEGRAADAVEWVRRRDPVRWVLGLMVTVWAVTFIWLGWLRQTRFGTFDFDLGIYDQGVWLLSRFKDPFDTVRGLELFGHHVNLILVAFVPAYWFGAGAKFLLVVQVAAQASGAIAIYLLARDRLRERWLAVALAAVLLLNPTYQFLSWEYFHPDALAIAPLLFAYWAARAGRWRWFTVAAVLALACKEDVALALAVMGLLIALRGNRRVGVLVTAIAVAWYAIATRVIIPHANGIGPFYDSYFGRLGKSPTEVAKNSITHPGTTFDIATRPDRMSYYRMMLAPVAFLPLVALPTFLIGGPMLAVNVLSTFPYLRDIRYHWSSLVLAGVMLGTVEAIAFLGRRPGFRRFLVGLVVACSLGSTVAWGASPLSVKYHTGIWPLATDARQSALEKAVATVPDGAATTATYQILPHLAHRERIYSWPEPWRRVNWGVNGENLPNPAGVQWLAIDRTVLNQEDVGLLDHLLSYEFRVRFSRDNVVVAQRVHPPPGS